MEAHGCREFPADSRRGRFVRRALEAAVARLHRAALRRAARRAGAGRAAGHARHGRPRDDLPARAHPLRRRRARRARSARADLARRSSAPTTCTALDDLYARLIWIADGENEPLRHAARALPRRSSARPTRRPAGGGDRRGATPRAPATGSGPATPTAPSAADDDGRRRRRLARRRARAARCERARAGQLEQLDEDVDLAATLEQAARRGPARRRARAAPAPARRRAGCPTAASTARRSPTRSSEARRYAQRLLRRPSRSARGGSTSARPAGASTAAPTRAAAPSAPPGGPSSTHPWHDHARDHRADRGAARRARRSTPPARWARYEYALGPIVWILTDGAPRRSAAGCATALFGNGAALLSDGTEPMALVPAIRAGGGTAFAGDAIALGADQLEMTNPPPPARRLRALRRRLVRHRRPACSKIRWLAEHGVPTIHLSIGAEPLSVEADRICVITDPADGARPDRRSDTVDALSAARRRPPAA